MSRDYAASFVRRAGRRPYRDCGEKELENPPTDPEIIEALLAEHRQVNSGRAVASLARSIKSGEATLSDDRLAALKMETLIVHGTQDGIVPVGASRNLASKLPNASFHELDNAGHWPQLERPETFHDLIADTLY